MKKQQLRSDTLRSYSKLLCSFLVLIIASLLVFFYCVQKDIESNTRQIIMQNMEQQTSHFESIFNIHYEYLEGISRYIGQTDDILSESNLELIGALAGKSSLDFLAIIDSDGVSYYSNGETNSVSTREYFQEAMTGKRTLSEPVISKVDGTVRIILCVPVIQAGKTVGVLGGSYNLKALSDLLFEDIFDANGSFLVINPEGETVFCKGENAPFYVNTGDNLFSAYERKNFRVIEAGGQPLEDLKNQESGITKIARSRDRWYLAYRPLGLNDWYLCYVIPVKTAQASFGFITKYEIILFSVLIAGIIAVLFLIFRTSSRRQTELLVYGQTDALTGLYNKKTTEELIDLALTDGSCVGLQAFFMLDIDHFKEINDHYGHTTGDDVLKEFGEILRQEFCDVDIIGRIGGDEFCILMKNTITETITIERAENLCRRIRAHSFASLGGKNITSSIGISFSPQHGSDYASLYQCADQALYEAKRRGRNGYTLYRQP